MSLSKDDCIKLFEGYLLNNESPLRINLPRDLVFQILGESSTQVVKEGIIDVTWYYDEPYIDNPYSLFNIELKKQNYIDEYNQWRNTIDLKPNNTDEVQDFTNFRDILDYAALNKQTVVIGESHNHSTPKAILMHNIEFLKQNNAVIFIEGARVELQEELNKSVQQRKPTPLIEAYLNLKNPNEPSSYYTENNLIRICIQEGIPVIGCEEGNCQSYGMDDFYQLGSGGTQFAGVLRMLQNYEHYKAIVYANEKFPDKTLHVSLVGDAHTPTYQSTKSINGEFYPGIVDITGGIYVHAVDAENLEKRVAGWVVISKDVFFDEIKKFGNLKRECYEYINEQLFGNNDFAWLNNVAVLLKAPTSYTGLEPNETALKELYTKYSKYIQVKPAQKKDSVHIKEAHGTIKSGYEILGHDEKEFTEKEGHLTKVSTIESSLSTQNNIQSSSKVQLQEKQGKKPKFFIFDRDDTLIDKNLNLINKERIFNILNTISCHPDSGWAIASAGGIDLENDPAFSAIVRELNTIKKPAYIQFSSSINGLLNRISSIEYLHYESSEKSLIGSDPNTLALSVALNGELIEETRGQFIVQSDKPKVKFTFNNDAKVQFKIGQTFYTMSLKRLRDNLDLLEQGKFKLFFIFDALNQAQLKLNLEDCPQMKSFGITAIAAPDAYYPIDIQDVVFCDDTPGNVALATLNGFVGIDADTSCSSKWAKAEKHDTYLDKLDFHCAAITIATLKEEILNGIHNGDFTTGFFGLTGISYTYHKEGQEHTINIPHTISALLNLCDNQPTPELLDQMIAIVNKTLTQRPTSRPLSNLFFYRPPAAQSIYDRLSIIKLADAQDRSEEDEVPCRLVQ